PEEPPQLLPPEEPPQLLPPSEEPPQLLPPEEPPDEHADVPQDEDADVPPYQLLVVRRKRSSECANGVSASAATPKTAANIANSPDPPPGLNELIRVLNPE